MYCIGSYDLRKISGKMFQVAFAAKLRVRMMPSQNQIRSGRTPKAGRSNLTRVPCLRGSRVRVVGSHDPKA